MFSVLEQIGGRGEVSVLHSRCRVCKPLVTPQSDSAPLRAVFVLQRGGDAYQQCADDDGHDVAAYEADEPD